MKYTLFFEQWGYSENPEEKDAKSVCVAAWKQISLPFVPSIGMELSLQSILSNHPNSDDFRKALKRRSVTVTGIFEVERIMISVDHDGKAKSVRLETSLICDWGQYPKIEDVNAAVEQLVHGYGFKRYGDAEN